MAHVRITQKFVLSATTKLMQEDFWDEALPGFVLRVFRGGKKSYNVTYRTELGRRGRFNIGDAKLISLSDARSKAKEILLSVEKGADPSERRRQQRSANTINELGALYLELHCRPRLRPRSIKDVEYVLKHHLLPAWGSRKIAEVKRSDVIVLLETIGIKRKAPVLANHVRSTITAIFRFALERGLIETSPSVGLPRKYQEVARARVLSDMEIIAFWGATNKEHPIIRDLFRCLLLLGQRSGETRSMSWDQIEDNTWTIPSSITKNKQQHTVPLSTQVLEILEGQRGVQKLLFPSFTGEPLKWMYCANQRVRESMEEDEVLKEQIAKLKEKPEPWRLHDLRRTCATGLEKLGYSDSVIAAVLNHTKASRLGVTGRYTRHDFDEEKRRAVQAWSDYVYRLIDTAEEQQRPAKILPFSRR